ncbi:gliding motility lipoprotein GldH [Tenacibaculum sp. IB213877]|uniref:gliding motility lipoprotein GldH n=1 Tax=Tenacibaculum sp. IB213877 TaxID=3097351 RepID=UPI002A5A7925|nr:gliding motility lipoprotein GldH [Tenacibaculum sp. IB213877]MDY0780563.1 gliding motility lipoprotein GldH [Tenacibaculum sp. IB213877]
MTRTIKNNKLILIISFLFVLVSCDSKRIFDEYTTISSNKWKANDPISFHFEVSDTLAKRNLFINIRNNNNYSFSNLFLITKMSFPDGQKMIDTLEYDMADNTGKFLGQGFSEIKENKLFYKENITFPTLGEYAFEVRHAMRKNGDVNGVHALEGITDVGFRIEKIE